MPPAGRAGGMRFDGRPPREHDGGVTDPLYEPRPRFAPEDAAAILASVYGLSGELAELHGERDLNFRVEASDGRRYLLKIHNPHDGADVVDMRTEALAHIRGVDPALPICDVVRTADGTTRAALDAADGRRSQVQLFSFLEGRHAGRDELGRAALFQWGRCVASLGKALRGYFHPAAGYAIQWDVRHTGALRHRLALLGPEHRRLAEHVVDRFEEKVAPRLPGLRAQVVHNDMSRDNLLVDGEGRIVGITDFGDMTHTALVCDLAVAIADVLDGRPDSLELARHMIAGYQSVTALETEESAVLGDLVAARLATAVVVSTWRRKRHADAPSFPGGAVEFLRLLEAEGLDEVARRVATYAADGSPSAARLPYRRRGAELLAERRAVLGPLELSYDEPLHLVRGEGVRLFDVSGRSYLDAYNNVPVVGHCHPVVWAAIAAQGRLLVTNTRYLHESSVELAERLVALAPPGLDRVMFVNSGSEANDLAWRIARHATGHSGAVVTRFAYHGVTEATTALSPEEWEDCVAPAHVRLLTPPGGGPGGDGAAAARRGTTAAEAVADLATGAHRVAALFVDPGFTSDGILGPANDWIAAASAAVRAGGGLVVGDEVQAGYGRTGDGLWSISSSGVAPELMTLGKPMGNGFPVAAVLGRSGLVDAFIEETGYFSTFGGNTLACVAALAVLGVVQEEGLVEQAAAVGAHLRARLEEVARRHEEVAGVRSWGLLCGIDIVEPGGPAGPAPDAGRARAVVNRLRRLGVLVGVTGPAGNILKIRPPLVFARSDADEVAERLDEAFGRS